MMFYITRHSIQSNRLSTGEKNAYKRAKRRTNDVMMMKFAQCENLMEIFKWMKQSGRNPAQRENVRRNVYCVHLTCHEHGENEDNHAYVMLCVH